jgi:hypothetical protein
MRRWRAVRLAAVTATALLSVLALPDLALAGGPGVWTKLATVDNGEDTVGMLRTGDGRLHLVWLRKQASNGTRSYGTSTITLAGKLLATGTALANWTSLDPDPQLVPYGTAERLIFNGNMGTSGCFHSGAVLTATSTNGSTWRLVQGALSHATVGVSGLAATAELNGTPVSSFNDGHLFHVGVDSSCPATTADGTIPVTQGAIQINPSIVTDSHDGSVWVAWFQNFKKVAYWVERILPSQGQPIEAPHSAMTSQNNQPFEPVALAARGRGGVYMAYCVASSSQPCAHVDLWRVGSSKPAVVPGSANNTNARVALAAGPQGRLWVAWYNQAKNVIHAVRTNTAATLFGVVRTIKSPPRTGNLASLQAQGSSGRLDIIINDSLTTPGFPTALFHTQILPGLSLHASPRVFSHTKAATVTFTVADAGQPVAGAKVSCPGKAGTTTNTGQAKIHFSKGTPAGFHVCTATKAGYNPGKVTLKVK